MLKSLLSFAIVIICSAGVAQAGFVNLNSWTAETYGSNANWDVAADGSNVVQRNNGDPTMFYSDFNAQNSVVTGKIEVLSTAGDNDFVGFALGFNPGDSASGSADYLLVDWKQGNQYYNFGGNSTPGTTGKRGLAVSRVTGLPTLDEFWGHQNLSQNALGGVSELARATNLGDTGWAFGTEYEFSFEFLANSLNVYVDNVLELSVNGNFNNGRMAFYNFSQGLVKYSAFEFDPVPEPASIAMWSLLCGIGVVAARRRKA